VFLYGISTKIRIDFVTLRKGSLCVHASCLHK